MIGIASLVCALLTGCTTFTWTDPESGSVVSWSSSKDINASGLLVEIEYYPDGSRKLIHVEIGNVSGTASEIVNSITEGVTTGVIEGLKIGAGIP